MEKDTQARKILLTINNPEQHGLTRKKLLEQYNLLTSSVYMCMCDEIGEQGTPHTHMYIYSQAPIRFSRIKNVFPEAHIDKARGTHQQIRDYILKAGKYANSEKAKTNLPETFYEIGELPPERVSPEEKRVKLYKMIKAGMTNAEIIEEDQSYIYQIKHMNEIREMLITEKYAEEDREITITYIYGATGTGKTRGIHEKHGARNICRITNYRKDGTVYFDGYNGEDVLVFEEFRGQVNLADLLSWVDRYPIKLPARYFDRQACFTKVFFTSNESLYQLYPEIQLNNPEMWSAFLRRINKVVEYKADGTVIEKEMHPKKE